MENWFRSFSGGVSPKRRWRACTEAHTASIRELVEQKETKSQVSALIVSESIGRMRCRHRRATAQVSTRLHERQWSLRVLGCRQAGARCWSNAAARLASEALNAGPPSEDCAAPQLPSAASSAVGAESLCRRRRVSRPAKAAEATRSPMLDSEGSGVVDHAGRVALGAPRLSNTMAFHAVRARARSRTSASVCPGARRGAVAVAAVRDGYGCRAEDGAVPPRCRRAVVGGWRRGALMAGPLPHVAGWSRPGAGALVGGRR